MPGAISPEQVETLRAIRGHRRPELRLHTEEQALTFINEVGFCFLFTGHGFAMPTLWEAICGETRAVSDLRDDPDLGRTWSWKDSLPSRKACFYGKLLCKTPTLLSLAYLPYFYALSPNYGHEDDYLEEYEEGRLSAECKWVYEALLKNGPQSTNRLRKLAGLDGKANAPRFERALANLQAGLKIVKAGISAANAWGYCYVYDLVLRQYPQVAEQARAIPSIAAEDALCLKYLEAAVCATPGEISRLFAWEPWRIERLIARLTAAGQVVTDMRWPDRKDLYLVRTADLALVT